MNELELTPDDQIGFRLQYLEVLNWGTFHDKIWRIVPDRNNSLLTGAIGSGKSTIVDALTCLIVPHHKIQFNKAAGAESKERNLISYIKGYYKHEKDELSLKEKAVSLRYTKPSDTTFSVILANFHNKGFEQHITLAQVFWIKEDKQQKLLLISKKPLTIKADFSNTSDIQELRKRLKSDNLIEVFDDNFTQYSQQFRRYFGMNSDKAIDLFNQTVSMKSVSSLTSFVREQMLERTDVKQQIDDLKKRFADLSKAHEAVVSLREQKETLEPLVGLATELRKITGEIGEIDNIIQALPSFFASRKYDLLETEIQNCDSKIKIINNQLEQIDKDLINKRRAEVQLRQDIFDNGGKRLEEIERLLKDCEERKISKKNKHDDYSILASICDLPIPASDKVFYNNAQKSEELIISLEKVQEELGQQQVDKSVDLRNLADEIKREQESLESLKKRKTQIPDDMLNIRQQIMEDLGIEDYEIPFIGELVKIREEEKDWEGAIERLLHGFGVSLIVPEKHYNQVAQYVNARQLQLKLSGNGGRRKGQRLEYYKVPESLKYKIQSDQDGDSVLNKIEIKPECIYEEWLSQELQKRFDLRCVSFEEFKRQKNVMTKEGQFKTGETRHIKDDRRDLWDRRNFVLGWTNKEKIKAIEEQLTELRIEEDTLRESLQKIRTELNNNKTLQGKLRQLTGFKNWNEINFKDEAREIEKLKQEQKELEESNDILRTLQEKLNLVKEEIEKLAEKEKSLGLEKGGKIKEVEGYNHAKDECMQIISLLQEEEVRKFYPKIEALIKEVSFTIKNIDKEREKIRASFTDKNGEKDKLSSKLSKARENIIKQMKDYKGKFSSESAELSSETESLPEYLKKFEEIIQQDLPRHERRFKEMLNENTINDISSFDNKLDIHQKSILEKIGKINDHLKEIEYNKGTYIKIETDKNTESNDIDTFRRKLKACYSNIMDSQDAYTEERFNQVKELLDKFNSQANIDIEWTNKVTDVRNWFIFNANEKYLADDSPKEFYSGTSGKSGGQKEKLAYTILASALAYQFGLTYGELQSKSFRFVVIDEAFGRGDDESTKFGLGLFKKLNLQLLIVTPLQKIHIIENHVNAVHYVSNPGGNYSEIQNLTVAEYKAEKLKKQLSNLS